VTRSLLGVGNDPEDLPPGGGIGSLPSPAAYPSRMATMQAGRRRRYGR
jgi:hypothetical protein